MLFNGNWRRRVGDLGAEMFKISSFTNDAKLFDGSPKETQTKFLRVSCIIKMDLPL